MTMKISMTSYGEPSPQSNRGDGHRYFDSFAAVVNVVNAASIRGILPVDRAMS